MMAFSSLGNFQNVFIHSFIHSFNLIDPLTQQTYPARARHCARYWECGDELKASSSLWRWLNRWMRSHPRKSKCSWNTQDKLESGLQPDFTQVIWCCHLPGTFFFTAFNHRLGWRNQNFLGGQGSHFQLCMQDHALFLHEHTFPLPLHQHHMAPPLTPPELQPPFLKVCWVTCAVCPGQWPHFSPSHRVLPVSLCLKALVFGFLPALGRVRVSCQDTGSVCRGSLTRAGRGWRPLPQILLYRGAVLWVGVVYFHPLGCFRMLSRSQGSGD